MTHSDLPAPRKPRRLGLFGPFVLLALAAVVYSGVWLWLSGETGRQIDAAAAAAKRAGYDVTWETRTIGGYPFRLNVDFTALRISTASGWAVMTPKLRTETTVLALGHWVADLPEGLTFTRPRGGTVRVTGEVLHASIRGLDGMPPSFSLEGSKLVFAPQPGAGPFFLATAENLQFHLRPGPTDLGGVFFTLEGGAATPGGLFARVAAGKPVAIRADSEFTHASALRGADWPAMIRAWTDRGGVLRLRQIGVTAGDASLSATAGELSVGVDGRLRGAISASLRGAPEALIAMGDAGTLTRETAVMAAAVAAAREQNGAATMTIDFQAGQTTLGPIAIAPAPQVY